MAVVNYTDDLHPYTRVIEHKHFVGSTCPGTVLTYEYSRPASANEEPFYPVNDEKNNMLRDRYLNDARKLKTVCFGGRLGTYRYMDMDDVILQAWDDYLKIAEGMVALKNMSANR